MKLRKVIVGAALGAGGLLGIDAGTHAVLEHAKPTQAHECPSSTTSYTCRHLGKPIDAYVAVVSGNVEQPEGIQMADAVLLGLGIVATAAGTVTLVHATCQQITETLPGPVHSTTSGITG